MLGSPARYMDITRYWVKLGCPVWYMYDINGSKAMLGYTEQPNLALEPSVMSLYPTGQPNLAKDSTVMPHYMSALLKIRPKNLSWPSLSPCFP
jgi:hypothetical protein